MAGWSFRGAQVLADDMTRQVKAGLSDQEGIYLNFDPERAAAAAR
jgi:hypothetical protein